MSTYTLLELINETGALSMDLRVETISCRSACPSWNHLAAEKGENLKEYDS
jgi:hypothetical protein